MSIEQKIAKIKSQCLSQGKKFTEPREVVLRFLLTIQKPSTAYDVVAGIQEAMPGAKPATVYRALDFLMSMHVIHRVEAIKSYILCSQAKPHAYVQFVVCDKCGDVREIELAHEILGEIAQVTRRVGFADVSPTIEVHGTCLTCH